MVDGKCVNYCFLGCGVGAGLFKTFVLGVRDEYVSVRYVCLACRGEGGSWSRLSEERMKVHNSQMAIGKRKRILVLKSKASQRSFLARRLEVPMS